MNPYFLAKVKIDEKLLSFLKIAKIFFSEKLVKNDEN